jgi:hypothetical protein
MKLLRYLVNTILFIVIFGFQLAVVVAFSFQYIRVGPSGLIAIGGLIALLTSYKLVKKINKSNLWSQIFDETVIINDEVEEKIYKVEVDKKEQDQFISKGWMRLHKIFGVLGGVLLHIPFALFSAEEDFFSESSVLLLFFWPIFYFVIIKTFLLTKKFNNGVISEIWFNRHIILSLIVFLFMNIIYIPLFGDFMNIADYVWVDKEAGSFIQGEEVSFYQTKIFSTNCLLFGLIFSLLYWMFICLTVWVIDGFRNEDK